MESIDFTLVYIMILTASIYSLACLNMYTFPDTYDMPIIVMYTSVTMSVFCLYYCIYFVFNLFIPITCLYKRRDHGNSDYNDIQIPDPTITYGRPRLYMKDVWLLVYGVGFSYYVMSYVMVCRNLLCSQSYTLGLFFLVLVEIDRHGWSPRNMIYCGAALLVLLGTLLKGSEYGYVYIFNMFETRDIISFVYSVSFPLLSSFVIVFIDTNKKYTFGGIYELCELGFPFAFISASWPLISFYNYSITKQDTFSFDFKHLCVTAFVGPVPLLIIIVFVIEAMLKSHIIDVLISFSIASSVFELVQDSTNPMSLVSIVLSVAAFVIRMSLLTKWIPPGNNPLHIQRNEIILNSSDVTTTTNLKMPIIDEDDGYDDMA